MTYICPNVLCRKERCFDHCNHCGETIIWRHPNLDKEIKVKNPRALNSNGSIHNCMLQGTKDHRFYKVMTLQQLRRYRQVPGYTPEQVEAEKDPIKKAAWEAQREEWLRKWEPALQKVVAQQ